MKKILYMIVTRDEYELPLAVEDSSINLARRIGMNPNTLRSSMSHGYKGYCKVEVEEDDCE